MIDPVNMSVTQWADAVVLSITDAWAVGKLEDPTQWQTWGVSLVRAFAPRALPDPYQFSDWREWAMRVYPGLEPVAA